MGCGSPYPSTGQLWHIWNTVNETDDVMKSTYAASDYVKAGVIVVAIGFILIPNLPGLLSAVTHATSGRRARSDSKKKEAKSEKREEIESQASPLHQRRDKNDFSDWEEHLARRPDEANLDLIRSEEIRARRAEFIGNQTSSTTSTTSRRTARNANINSRRQTR